MENKINLDHLKIIYSRIIDLEDRGLPFEWHKLEPLYRLENEVLKGYQLTKEDIVKNKLDKYTKGD